MLLTNKISLLRQALDEANSYEEWKEIALELDRVSGLDLWKLDNASEHYNHDLIRDRLMQLRQLMRQKDHRQLMRALREGLYHDIGNIGNPLLYTHAHVGTKRLIEDYVDQVCLALNYLCDTEIDFLTTEQKHRFFEDTYIIFLINKYDFSLKKQLVNPKKIYFIDTALASQISFRFTEDRGRFIENVVFLQLKRKNHQLYYHKNMYECDFLIREGLHIVKALQVSVSILNEDTYTREIKGLMEALTMYNLNEGYIITEQDDEREIIIEDKKIFVLPIWKWLLT